MPFLTCYSGEYALKEYTEVKTVSFSSPLQSSRNICGGIFLYEICEIHVICWFTNAASPQLYLGSFFWLNSVFRFFLWSRSYYSYHMSYNIRPKSLAISIHIVLFFLSSFVAIYSSPENTFRPSTVFYIETS